MKNKKLFLLLSSTVGIVAPVTTVMAMNLHTKNSNNTNKHSQNISTPLGIKSRWYNYTKKLTKYESYHYFVEQTFVPTNIANNWRYHGPHWATQLMYATWTADGGKTASGPVGQAAKTWATSNYSSLDGIAYNVRNSMQDSISNIYGHIGKKGVTVETVTTIDSWSYFNGTPVNDYTMTTYTNAFTDYQTGPF